MLSVPCAGDPYEAAEQRGETEHGRYLSDDAGTEREPEGKSKDSNGKIGEIFSQRNAAVTGRGNDN